MNETRLRVRYAETDQMGVVYHSNHLIWFEVGRVELMRADGVFLQRYGDRKMVASSPLPKQPAATGRRLTTMRRF